MSTVNHDPGGHALSNRGRPTRTLPPVQLLGALIAIGLAVIAVAILADGSIRAETSVAGECPVITERADRLACYDHLGRPPPPQPARGANAPVLFRSL